MDLKDRPVAMLERLFALSDYLESRRFGASVREIAAALPSYTESQAGERKLYRDLELLLEMRPFTCVAHEGTRIYLPARRALASTG